MVTTILTLALMLVPVIHCSDSNSTTNATKAAVVANTTALTTNATKAAVVANTTALTTNATKAAVVANTTALTTNATNVRILTSEQVALAACLIAVNVTLAIVVVIYLILKNQQETAYN